MSAHESGSTIMKKIANVAVGKSTASGQPRRGRVTPGRKASRRALRGRRVEQVSSPFEANQERSSGTLAASGDTGRRRLVRSLSARAANHSPSATSTQAATITPAIAGRRARRRRRALRRRRGTGSRGGATGPRSRELAESRPTAPMPAPRGRDRGALVPAGAIHLAGRKRVRLRPSACTSSFRLRPVPRARARRRPAPPRARSARVRPASSRTGPPWRPGQLSSEDFISSSAARPCSCTSARRR